MAITWWNSKIERIISVFTHWLGLYFAKPGLWVPSGCLLCTSLPFQELPEGPGTLWVWRSDSFSSPVIPSKQQCGKQGDALGYEVKSWSLINWCPKSSLHFHVGKLLGWNLLQDLFRCSELSFLTHSPGVDVGCNHTQIHLEVKIGIFPALCI